MQNDQSLPPETPTVIYARILNRYKLILGLKRTERGIWKDCVRKKKLYNKSEGAKSQSITPTASKKKILEVSYFQIDGAVRGGLITLAK